MSSTTPAYFSLIAGAAAGSVESFTTYPTEYVKTRAQLSAKSATPNKPLDIVKETLREKGIRGFYGGCFPVICGNALKAGTRFLTYDTGKLTPAKTMLAGVAAGCVESIVAVTPSEAIKTRIIEAQRVQVATPVGTLNLITGIVRTEGILAFYRGLVPTGLRDLAVKWNNGGSLSNLSVMGIGGTAGIITVYATMPFDVVKTRMQQAGSSAGNSFRCAQQIIMKEGVKTFWQGSSPRVLRLLVSGSVTFVIFENVMAGLKAVV
ncbi:putative Tricarboxylate transport protein (ctp) [Pseudohyphozyma bogoriensis]|nr:putative Tricarboxylate transport protein (ctp) [Pseudohyphozyma bogoriensis]